MDLDFIHRALIATLVKVSKDGTLKGVVVVPGIGKQAQIKNILVDARQLEGNFHAEFHEKVDAAFDKLKVPRPGYQISEVVAALSRVLIGKK